MDGSQVQREHTVVRNSLRRRFGALAAGRYRTVQIGIALLLFFAAVLKTHQLATEPVLGSGCSSCSSLFMPGA